MKTSCATYWTLSYSSAILFNTWACLVFYHATHHFSECLIPPCWQVNIEISDVIIALHLKSSVCIIDKTVAEISQIHSGLSTPRLWPW